MGGLSSFLAWSILSSTQEILGQSHHIEVTESIHATIHHLIREVDRAIIEGSLDRQSHMADLTIRVRSTIAAFLEDADLSPREIDELQKILEQKRKG